MFLFKFWFTIKTRGLDCHKKLTMKYATSDGVYTRGSREWSAGLPFRHMVVRTIPTGFIHLSPPKLQPRDFRQPCTY